jgi:hypothetical protein
MENIMDTISPSESPPLDNDPDNLMDGVSCSEESGLLVSPTNDVQDEDEGLENELRSVSGTPEIYPGDLLLSNSDAISVQDPVDPMELDSTPRSRNAMPLGTTNFIAEATLAAAQEVQMGYKNRMESPSEDDNEVEQTPVLEDIEMTEGDDRGDEENDGDRLREDNEPDDRAENECGEEDDRPFEELAGQEDLDAVPKPETGSVVGPGKDSTSPRKSNKQDIAEEKSPIESNGLSHDDDEDEDEESSEEDDNDIKVELDPATEAVRKEAVDNLREIEFHFDQLRNAYAIPLPLRLNFASHRIVTNFYIAPWFHGSCCLHVSIP